MPIDFDAMLYFLDHANDEKKSIGGIHIIKNLMDFLISQDSQNIPSLKPQVEFLLKLLNNEIEIDYESLYNEDTQVIREKKREMQLNASRNIFILIDVMLEHGQCDPDLLSKFLANPWCRPNEYTLDGILKLLNTNAHYTTDSDAKQYQDIFHAALKPCVNPDFISDCISDLVRKGEWGFGTEKSMISSLIDALTKHTVYHDLLDEILSLFTPTDWENYAVFAPFEDYTRLLDYAIKKKNHPILMSMSGADMNQLRRQCFLDKIKSAPADEFKIMIASAEEKCRLQSTVWSGQDGRDRKSQLGTYRNKRLVESTADSNVRECDRQQLESALGPSLVNKPDIGVHSLISMKDKLTVDEFMSFSKKALDTLLTHLRKDNVAYASLMLPSITELLSYLVKHDLADDEVEKRIKVFYEDIKGSFTPDQRFIHTYYYRVLPIVESFMLSTQHLPSTQRLTNSAHSNYNPKSSLDSKDEQWKYFFDNAAFRRRAPVEEIAVDHDNDIPFIIHAAAIAPASAARGLNQFYSGYGKFVKSLAGANSHAPERLKINADLFLQAQQVKFANIQSMLGDDAFSILRQMVDSSFEGFKRFIDGYECLTSRSTAAVRQVVNANKQILVNEPENLIKLIELISKLEALNNFPEQTLHLALAKMNTKVSSAQEMTALFMNDLITTTFTGQPDSSITAKDVEDFVAKTNPEYLFKLVRCWARMRDHHLESVFDNMVIQWIRGGAQINEYLTNLEQDNVIGVELATHNKKITDELSQAGVNVDIALHYKKQDTFSVSFDRAQENLHVAFRAIWLDIERINQNIDIVLEKATKSEQKLPKEDEQYLKRLKKHVKNLMHQVQIPVKYKIKQGDGPLEERIADRDMVNKFLNQFSNTAIIDLMNKTQEIHLSATQSQRDNPDLAHVIEFADHYLDRYSTITERLFADPQELIILLQKCADMMDKKTDQVLIEQFTDLLNNKNNPNYFRENRVLTQVRKIASTLQERPDQQFKTLAKNLKTQCSIIQGVKDKKEISKPKQFRVEMWDKSKFETLFLGDFLSCCLASDGAYFESMVERIVDSALLFPVVVDVESNLPVSGVWLFLAHDIDNPDNIVAVSNFIEINVNYGLKDGVRNAFMQHLLQFTHDYTKAAGIKGGFIMQPLTYGLIPDFTHFNLPSEAKAIAGIEKVGSFYQGQEYYLNALYSRDFHYFSPEALAKEYPSGSTAECNITTKKPSSELLKGAAAIQETKENRSPSINTFHK